MSPSQAFAIRGLMGLKFVDGGRDPIKDGGVDCWGLAILAANVFGIMLPDWRGISCDDGARVGAVMGLEASDESRWLRLDKPEPGAVALFRSVAEHPDLCTHAGVCLDDRRIIHTYREHRAVIARLSNPHLSRICAGVWRWIG